MYTITLTMRQESLAFQVASERGVVVYAFQQGEDSPRGAWVHVLHQIDRELGPVAARDIDDLMRSLVL